MTQPDHYSTRKNNDNLNGGRLKVRKLANVQIVTGQGQGRGALFVRTMGAALRIVCPQGTSRIKHSMGMDRAKCICPKYKIYLYKLQSIFVKLQTRIY